MFAIAFLLFLMIEWGSHNLAFAHSSSDGGSGSMQSQQDRDEDPCKNMMRCSDGPRREQTSQRVAHDTIQYEQFFNDLLTTRRLVDLFSDPRLRRSRLEALFRPPDPPFHPPQLS